MALAPTQLLRNRYRILSSLKQGGMGEIYLAFDLQTNARVAIKESFSNDPTANAAFQQEAQILSTLTHANLPRVSNFFIDPSTSSGNGARYLVMDFVEGQNLQDIVQARGKLTPADALHYLRSIFAAVEYLHAQPYPIIHRDINPRNIIITPQARAVLVDFGIAKVLTGTKTTHGLTGYGTPGYAPPEQYSGGTDRRTDVYALGATLYFILTGQAPPESPMRAAGTFLAPPSQLNPQISMRVERAILTALNLTAAQRFATARDLEQALYAATQPLGATATLPEPVVQRTITAPSPPRPSNAPLVLLGLVGGIFLAALMMGGLYLGGVFGGATATPTLIGAITNTPTPSGTTTVTPTVAPLTTVPPITTVVTPPTDTPTLTPLTPDTPTVTPTPSETFTPTATVTPSDTPTRTLIPFAILAVQSNVAPASSNRCPTTFTFQGTLRANTSGSATYRWEFSDGRVFDNETVFFDGAGSAATTSVTWNFQGGQEIHASGWGQLHVLAPVELYSNQTNFQIDCVVTPTPTPTTPPPVGPVIAFTSERSGNNDVYLMNADGSNVRQLTNHGAKDEDPAPSPNGAQIAFTTYRDGNWEIYVMNADGSNQRNLSRHGGDDYAASWSPNGQQITFYSTRDNVRQIYVMNADGSNQRRISSPDNGGNTDDWAPVWSPNGSVIAYQGIPHRNSGGDGTADIFLIDPNGGSKRNLTQGSGADEESPAWSPNGNQILYQSNRNGNYDIWIMNADGSGQRTLTSGPGEDEYPAWSRDGRFILFQSNRDGDVDLYVMNADGSNIRRVTFGGGEDEYADWMP